MKKHNIALVILMSLGAVACSSGGGSSNTTTKSETVVPSKISGKEVIIHTGGTTTPSKTETTTPTAEVTPPKAETTTPTTEVTPPKTEVTPLPAQPTPKEITDIAPNFDNVYVNNYKFSGVRFHIPREDGGEVEHFMDWNPKGNGGFYVIDVDGKKLDIVPVGMENNKSINISGQNITRIIKQGEHTVWGIVDATDTNHIAIVSKGINPTQNMPQAGEFKYKGTAHHLYDALKVGNVNKLEDGNIELTANFDNKEIRGTVSPVVENNSFKAIELGAKIKGNYFEGTVDGIMTQGGFFGDNAKEVSGNYVRPNSGSDTVLGVFGASKQ
ncbi:hypothetical protein BMT54_03790 [Pasteurellaceae bacterium 15-036681]|nr:hypothetical protein BMT54_03790 [Pasteurellaceae bacterium 15-036681]